MTCCAGPPHQRKGIARQGLQQAWPSPLCPWLFTVQVHPCVDRWLFTKFHRILAQRGLTQRTQDHTSNYRPIALASIMSKLLEKMILNRISDNFVTNPNQFGFKPKHNTEMCIFALKEAILKYRALNSNVYSCFLDASNSKAFDRVNHSKLFETLAKRGVLLYIIRIMRFWYTSQTMYVHWNNVMSSGFKVTNGVRQGGILSPYLFCV